MAAGLLLVPALRGVDWLAYVVSLQLRMNALIHRLWREEDGQDLSEYGLMLVLVSLAAIASMSTFANAVKTLFSTAAANVSTS